MNEGDCVALFIFYCNTKLILYRKALNNASQMAMRYHLLATLSLDPLDGVDCPWTPHPLLPFKFDFQLFAQLQH